MPKAAIPELLSTLKSYAQKLSDGDRTPSEIASALNDWAHESAESVRGKIHEEVETAVLKMGFVKREEFDALADEVASLKKSLKKNSTKNSAVKKSSTKSEPKKSSKKITGKKNTEKKSTAKSAARKKAEK
jgi:BMFP domain-containing protein YqiC